MVLQVLAAFNRTHISPPPDTNREDEEMEGVTANEEPEPSPGNYKIRIEWEIPHIIFGTELMAYRY